MTETLSREQWETALDRASPPTFGELVAVLEEADMISADPDALVEDAIQAGILTESGGFNLTVAPPETTGEEADSPDVNPGEDPGESGSSQPNKEHESDTWDRADFTNPEAGVYPPALLERKQWMGHQRKRPFAPWGDPDASVECRHNTCANHNREETSHDVIQNCDRCQAHKEGTTTAECDHDARYKWGYEENYVDGEKMRMGEEDPQLDGRVFLQKDEDEFAFVDGDDVRDPKTGEVHPGFVAILEHLGLTYADASRSGTGVHAYYRGELPIRGKGQASFEIDTEAWGVNADPPTVEIYANKHVNVTTGEHVPGTPLEVREWNADVLRTILQSAGYRDAPMHDTNREREDLDDHTPDATEANQTTTDIKDVLYAVDRLEPPDVNLDTTLQGTDSTGWQKWDPSTYRTSGENESLHYNNEGVFHDKKKDEAFGVLGLLAAERGIISDPWDRLQGEDWWEAVDEARDDGAPIPKHLYRHRVGYEELRETALDQGFVTKDDLTPRRNKSGERYLSLPGPVYARTIRFLEAEGIETHRRDHLDAESPYHHIDLTEYTDGDANPYADRETLLAASLRARDDEAVPEDSTPPAQALAGIVDKVTGRDETLPMRSGTREMVMDIFENELTSANVGEGDTVTIP